ncbi:MAG TPA: hypothetical protein VM864_13225 [Pyrinomonadaceae bacterium]|jgi:hypothetical protein|nr:hypothetical protein [Pyrinomonadaceae bacterium]
MSDYLWDKTGEPEPEVERLEELLGGLRFQPRTFEVPATLPFAPRRATPARTSFNWSRLAVAASLIVTLLLGAWLVVSKRQTADAPQFAHQTPAPEEKVTPRQDQTQSQPPQQQLAGATPKNDVTTPARDEKRDKVDRVVVPNVSRRQREATQVAFQKRFGARPRHSSVRNLNAPREEIATMTPREKEAMEKFMLAMKVTSEKLGYAERQVAGLSRESPQR